MDRKAPLIDTSVEPPQAPPPPYSETSNSMILTPTSSPSVSVRDPLESLSPTPEPDHARNAPPPPRQERMRYAARPADAHRAPTHAYTAVTGDAKWPQPPPDAQRARAPLLVSQKNHGIRGDWFVFLDGDGKGAALKARALARAGPAVAEPDVLLQTTNSRISAAVWVDESEGWERERVIVNAKTTNSAIELAVHTMRPGQAVDIYAKTTNSSNSVLLPRDFHGVLKLSTSNNKCVLSDSLKRHSVRIPCGPEEKRSRAEWYEIGGPHGPSVAELRSTNSRVAAGLLGGEDEKSGELGSNCCLM